MSLPNIIFLTGYMGSGKTTAGKKLAAKIDYHFLDLDQEIERIEGKSIPEIFKSKGEDYFRSREKAALQSCFEKEKVVVACGGGTPCYFDNLKKMKANGVVVYLEMKPAALADRLKNGIAQRPVLQNKTDKDLLAFITRQLDKRLPFYMKADIMVSGLDFKVEPLVERLQLK